MSHYLIQQIEDIPNITVRTCTEVIAGARRRTTWSSLTLRDTATGETRDGRRAVAVRLHRRGAAAPTGWTASWSATTAASSWPARTWSVGGQRPPAGTLDRPPYHLETSVPGRVRRRRRARRVGQAGRLRRRRGRDGRHAGAPLPGEADDRAPQRSRARCDRAAPTSCARCSCSRSSTDDQLAWLCREGRVELVRAGPGLRRGRARDLLLRAARRRRGAVAPGRRRTTSRSTGPRSAASTPGAFSAYLGDRVPQVYNNSLRVDRAVPVLRARRRHVRRR